MNQEPEHVLENRRYWDGMADQWVAGGERNWQQADPTWGIWGLPETDLKLLPEDMHCMHAVELGCGTGYVSAWMRRRGATVVGVDNSRRQLDTARRLCDLHGLHITLLHGNAESVPYPDASFDFAISEYGAAIWCDPYLWIPEAHRLLRPGGRLVFLGGHPLTVLCTPPSGETASRTLHRCYHELYRQDWRSATVDPGGIEFNLSPSGWLRLFRTTGFEVEDYVELFAPDTATAERFFVTAEWAKRWPSEQAWKLRKRRAPIEDQPPAGE